MSCGSLSKRVSQLEQQASTRPVTQCSEFCFLESCDRCATGSLYQAALLRRHAATFCSEMPPVPLSLYMATIKLLEKNKK